MILLILLKLIVNLGRLSVVADVWNNISMDSRSSFATIHLNKTCAPFLSMQTSTSVAVAESTASIV